MRIEPVLRNLQRHKFRTFQRLWKYQINVSNCSHITITCEHLIYHLSNKLLWRGSCAMPWRHRWSHPFLMKLAGWWESQKANELFKAHAQLTEDDKCVRYCNQGKHGYERQEWVRSGGLQGGVNFWGVPADWGWIFPWEDAGCVDCESGMYNGPCKEKRMCKRRVCKGREE